MRDVQTSRTGIVTNLAFYQSDDALIHQHHLSHCDVSLKCLCTYSYQGFRAQNIFHDVYNSGCNQLLAVLLLEQDGKVQDCLHEIHKRSVPAENYGHLH